MQAEKGKDGSTAWWLQETIGMKEC